MIKRIAIALLVVPPCAAAARSFPTKTVRIISPYPAGAGPDTAKFAELVRKTGATID